MLPLLSLVTPDLRIPELDTVDIVLRMLCAMAVGMVIGLEREYTHRPAGLRTHILVSLGACTVMIIGQLIFAQYQPLGANPDPARLAAQVISGVGFLGAGTIMREGVNVKGLTTAASLWAVACLGIAAGGGYYHVAMIGTVLMFLTLTVVEILQNFLMRGSRKSKKDYEILTSDASRGMNTINQAADLCMCRISGISITEQEQGTCIRFHAEFGSGGRKRRQQRFLDALNADPAIRNVTAETAPAGVR